MTAGTGPEPSADAGVSGSTWALLEDGFLGALILATAVIVLLQVLKRYVLNSPLTWSGEVSTDLLVWTSFVGLAVAVRDKAHVAMELLTRKLPRRGQSLLGVVQLLIVAVFLGSLVAGGLVMIWTQRSEVSPSGIPAWVVYASMPIGGLFGLLHAVSHLRALLPAVARGPHGRA